MTRRIHACALAALCWLAGPPTVRAAVDVRFHSQRGCEYLNIDVQRGVLAATCELSDPTGVWSLEPVPNADVFLIRNGQTQQYLQVVDGRISTGPAQAATATWALERLPVAFWKDRGSSAYALRNAATSQYLSDVGALNVRDGIELGLERNTSYMWGLTDAAERPLPPQALEPEWIQELRRRAQPRPGWDPAFLGRPGEARCWMGVLEGSNELQQDWLLLRWIDPDEGFGPSALSVFYGHEFFAGDHYVTQARYEAVYVHAFDDIYLPVDTARSWGLDPGAHPPRSAEALAGLMQRFENEIATQRVENLHLTEPGRLRWNNGAVNGGRDVVLWEPSVQDRQSKGLACGF